MINKPSDIASRDETGQVFMLDKKERILLRELLAKAINSAGAKKIISERLGPEYIEIGLNLLKQMGGK